MAGVIDPKDYAIFQNKGYQGLYGGLGAKEIAERKGLKKNQKILDHMGSTELAANLPRATQTDEKLRRKISRERMKQIKLITKLVVPFGKPLSNLVVQCRRTCPRRKKASVK